MEGAAEKKLCPIHDTVDGWSIMRIHYSVVPHYNYEEVSLGMSEATRQMELEINWNATTGKVVYPEYRYETHVALDPLPWRGETLVCGWDFGGCPAFVPSFINGFGQWCLMPPLAPLEDYHLGTYEFGEMVAEHLYQNYAQPRGWRLDQLKLVHYGDPQGNARPPRTKATEKHELRTAFQILREGLELPAGRGSDGEERFIKKPGWGWRIQPGALTNEERQTAVKTRLLSLIAGLPALIIDPRATVLKEGFGGMYRFPERANGHYADEPEKNWWSHSMDAMAYIATRLFAPPIGAEEEDGEAPHRVRSRAAGRDR